ncbi:MAG TPA: transcriptional regulator [Rubricoccaceae bacterium]|nr:transcriptional regulator [Rubricoccaceae bacterium]
MGNRLVRAGEVRRLEPKVMDVLACLASRPGETLPKDALMEEVWAGTVVTDDVVARCISALRKALGDDARVPRYVETVRKRGYRLVAPVTPVEGGQAATEVAAGAIVGASEAVAEASSSVSDASGTLQAASHALAEASAVLAEAAEAAADLAARTESSEAPDAAGEKQKGKE